MSRRFNLPFERRKTAGFPIWLAVTGGLVLAFLAGAAMAYWLFVFCDNSESVYEASQGQSTARELIGSSTNQSVAKTAPVLDEPSEIADTAGFPAGADSLSAIPEEAAAEVVPRVEAATESRISKTIRVQVLNGCGVKGIARNVAPALRKMGFDVRESRNAKNFRHEQSKIYDRIGNITLAYALADSVGIDSSLVGELPDPDLVDIDVTIVIGADYRDLKLGFN